MGPSFLRGVGLETMPPPPPGKRSSRRWAIRTCTSSSHEQFPGPPDVCTRASGAPPFVCTPKPPQFILRIDAVLPLGLYRQEPAHRWGLRRSLSTVIGGGPLHIYILLCVCSLQCFCSASGSTSSGGSASLTH